MSFALTLSSLATCLSAFSCVTGTAAGASVVRRFPAGQAFFFLPVRAIAPAAGAITSQSPIVTIMDVT